MDPKGFEAGDENLFRYCGDDPVDNTDPTGMMMSLGRAEVFSGMVEIQSGYTDGITGTNGSRLAASGSDLAQQYGPREPALTMGWGVKVGASNQQAHYSTEGGAAYPLAARAYALSQQNDGHEFVGQVSRSDKNSRDYIVVSGPTRGERGTPKQDQFGHGPRQGVVNQSSFSPIDPSPRGYHRVAIVYTHQNWRSNVDPEDRRTFIHYNLNAYLATPARAGSGQQSPRVLFYQGRREDE